MDRTKIKVKLGEAFGLLKNYVNQCSDEEFGNGPEGKWTVSQHLEHLRKSASMLNQGLGMPGMVLKPMFGTANRPSRTEQELRAKYNDKLENITGAPPADSQPRSHSEMDISRLKEGLDKEYAKMEKYLDKWSEEDLDKYILPHPLMGKCTLREMYYFTVYHTELHLETISVKYKTTV